MPCAAARDGRGGAALAFLATLDHFWANGAVGLICGERDPLNALFHLVPVFVVTGAVLVQLKPLSMARMMVAAATLHAALGATGMLLGPAGNLTGTAVVTGVFAAVFLLSAWLLSRPGVDHAGQAPTG